MRYFIENPILNWAVRDMMRQPFLLVLHGVTLVLITAVPCIVLLLFYGLNQTAQMFIGLGPSLVVRSVSSFGWTPIDEVSAITHMKGVPGIINPRSRVFGTVLCNSKMPVTVLGKDETSQNQLADYIKRLPEKGEVVVGHGVSVKDSAISLRSGSRKPLVFTVIGRFPSESDRFTHDLVLMDEKDARRLLSLPDGFASDVVGDIFHKEAEAAIQKELSQSMPFPVSITTQSEMSKNLAVEWSKKSAFFLLICVPAILAMIILVTASSREIFKRRQEVGLLKSLGWTTQNIVLVHGIRISLLGIPSTVSGLFIAYCLTFYGGNYWVSYLFFNWPHPLPYLMVNPSHAGSILIVVGTLVFIPYFLSGISSALLSAVFAPLDFMKGDFGI